MSKPFKIKDNKKIAIEVNLLLDSNFYPNAIKRYLKLHYGLDVSMATIYRYKRNHYRSKQYRKAVKDKILKDCGRFIDVIATKVALIELYKERIFKALEQEKKISIPLRMVDEMIGSYNKLLNELYGMYQDMGLLPIRDEKISIDATVTEKEKSKNSVEVLVSDLSSEDKSKLSENIKENINKFTKRKEDNGSYVIYTDNRS